MQTSSHPQRPVNGRMPVTPSYRFQPPRGTGAVVWLILLHMAILHVPVFRSMGMPRDFELVELVLWTGRLVQAALLGFWVVAGPLRLVPRVVLACIGLLLMLGIDCISFGFDGDTLRMVLPIYLSSMAASGGTVIVGILILGGLTDWLDKRPQFSLGDIAVWTIIAAATLSILSFWRDKLVDEFLAPFVWAILLILTLQSLYIGMLLMITLVRPGRPFRLLLLITVLAIVPFVLMETGVFFLLRGILTGSFQGGPDTELIVGLFVIKLPLAAITLATILPLRRLLYKTPPQPAAAPQAEAS